MKSSTVLTTVLALSLGRTATILAEPPDVRPIQRTSIDVGGSAQYGRTVRDNEQILPQGQQASGQMRFVTAGRSLMDSSLKFTDLALLDLSLHTSLGRRVDMNADVTLLPKQPSFTSEKVFQSGSVTVRGGLKPKLSAALSGSAGMLLGMPGRWTSQQLALQYRRELKDNDGDGLVSFEFQGGANATQLSPRAQTQGMVVEVGTRFSTLLRAPNGVWGGWIGIGYAVPVYSRGEALDGMSAGRDANAMNGIALDPQPRLDFTIGNSVRLSDKWDMFAAFTIVDRGDLGRAETMLPILDGGFDQKQFTLGLSRRLDIKLPKSKRSVSQPIMAL